MKKKIILFISMLILWCLLVWPPDWQHLLIGVGAALLAAYLTQDLYFQRPPLFKHASRCFNFVFVFVPVLFLEMVRTGVLVGLRIASPTVSLRPGIVKVRTSLKSDTALTFLANSITLATLALSVDLDRESGTLIVHWLDVKTTETEAATTILVKRFEDILGKVFD